MGDALKVKVIRDKWISSDLYRTQPSSPKQWIIWSIKLKVAFRHIILSLSDWLDTTSNEHPEVHDHRWIRRALIAVFAAFVCCRKVSVRFRVEILEQSQGTKIQSSWNCSIWWVRDNWDMSFIHEIVIASTAHPILEKCKQEHVWFGSSPPARSQSVCLHLWHVLSLAAPFLFHVAQLTSLPSQAACAVSEGSVFRGGSVPWVTTIAMKGLGSWDSAHADVTAVLVVVRLGLCLIRRRHCKQKESWSVPCHFDLWARN